MTIKSLLAKQKLTKKEETRLSQKLIEKLDILASQECKDKAFTTEKIKCYTCDKMIDRSQSNTAHFIERGRRKYRRDQDNLRVACVECNCFQKQRH